MHRGPRVHLRRLTMKDKIVQLTQMVINIYEQEIMDHQIQPSAIPSDLLVFRCRNSTAPEYLARDLQWAVDDDSRKRLRYASSHKQVVQHSRLAIEFRHRAPRVWNGLPLEVTSARALSTFKKHSKTHLFRQSFIMPRP